MITSVTSAAAVPAPASAPRIAAAPRRGAGMAANAPWNEPSGVRVAARITRESRCRSGGGVSLRFPFAISDRVL